MTDKITIEQYPSDDEVVIDQFSSDDEVVESFMKSYVSPKPANRKRKVHAVKAHTFSSSDEDNCKKSVVAWQPKKKKLKVSNDKPAKLSKGVFSQTNSKLDSVIVATIELPVDLVFQLGEQLCKYLCGEYFVDKTVALRRAKKCLDLVYAESELDDCIRNDTEAFTRFIHMTSTTNEDVWLKLKDFFVGSRSAVMLAGSGRINSALHIPKFKISEGGGAYIPEAAQNAGFFGEKAAVKILGLEHRVACVGKILLDSCPVVGVTPDFVLLHRNKPQPVPNARPPVGVRPACKLSKLQKDFRRSGYDYIYGSECSEITGVVEVKTTTITPAFPNINSNNAYDWLKIMKGDKCDELTSNRCTKPPSWMSNSQYKDVQRKMKTSWRVYAPKDTNHTLANCDDIGQYLTKSLNGTGCNIRLFNGQVHRQLFIEMVSVAQFMDRSDTIKGMLCYVQYRNEDD